MWIELLYSFAATVAYGILFNVPRYSLVPCGFVGLLSWFIYMLYEVLDISPLIAIFLSSFVVATVSEYLARQVKVPVTIFSIAGIIPLVPGGLAYTTMRSFVEGNINVGLTLGTQTMLSAGAIAGGLVVSVAISRLLKGLKHEAHHET